MNLQSIQLEYLAKQNIDAIRVIHREDVGEAWVGKAMIITF